MGRVSRAEAARHRDEVIEAAARLFRQRGVAGVSVADLMAEVGLTHGGFYRQFASKDALAAEAVAKASVDLAATVTGIADRNSSDVSAAREELVGMYLSADHRDDPGAGCPVSALGADAARDEAEAPLRAAYAQSVGRFVDNLARFDDDPADRAAHITTLCTLVGALTLARATAGDQSLSDEILLAAKGKLTA
jgi:TetR/AcrR family transcriptional repressor of nem operon